MCTIVKCPTKSSNNALETQHFVLPGLDSKPLRGFSPVNKSVRTSQKGKDLEFNPDQVKERRLHRLAEIIRDHWEEGNGMDTRFFEVPMIHDSIVMKGKSVNGGEYREHIVPKVLLRDECLKMYDRGATLEAVKLMLNRYLWIVEITKEEASQLDNNHGLKTKMPDGWVFGEGDPLARLKFAGIELA